MTSFTSMLLPAEMQVRDAEPHPATPSGSPLERHIALAAACVAAFGALAAALLLG